jgi:glyoxylase-like metal-dependent hydrolase (beta-lactamase superfamily II)
MHPLDAQWAFTEVNQFPPYYSVPDEPPEPPCLVADGDIRTDGLCRYQVIATPGHSPGGVSFYFPDEGVLFSGDTLFQGSVGRTALPGGDPRALVRSLQRLEILPDATRVYPGHGPPTTIGIEKRTNFFMRHAAT